MTDTVPDVRPAAAARELAEIDAARLVHPRTRHDIHSAENVAIFERAAGTRLWDVEGNEWFDTFSGLLNVSLGYGRPEITEAVKRSLDELSYATLFHARGHARASELAQALAAVTPAGIERFFFTVSGSDAVDSAIKFARLFNAHHGRPEKHQVIARRPSYHGMGFGGTSATGDPASWHGVGPMLPGFSHISYPDPEHPDAAEELEQRILELGPENVAAFIGEPVSMPAAAVVPPDDYWPRIREICTEHDVLLIVDEVVCGFGRTGRMFGISNWDVSPDLMIMSKSINNGAIPMGCVGMTDAVYAGLASEGRYLAHGFTGGGHPAACAAALATLDIIRDEDLVARSAQLGDFLAAELQAAVDRNERIRTAWNIGMLAAIQFEPDRFADPDASISQIMGVLRDMRVLARPYAAHNAIALGLPLTCDKQELTEAISRFEEAAAAVS